METTREELSPGQKRYVARCYAFMATAKEGGLFEGRNTRDLVAECLGVAHGTVSTVMKAYKEDNNTNFEPKPTERGKQRTYDSAELEPVIRRYIDSQNRLLQPVTAQKIIIEVQNECGVTLELRTMQRLLHELNFHYIVGKKRHISADTPANVAFRNGYLEKRLSNRYPEKKGKFDPRRTEVFLDESFYNVNHVSNKTWVLEDKIRFNKSGKGVRACIVAAMYVSQHGGRKEAGLVENATKCWNSTLKRKHSEMEEDADYHGNFDTVKFDRWFTKLCQTLQQKHGPCNIHMDGASYHKNQTNKRPTMSWTRPNMQAWLQSKCVNFSRSHTKAQLMELITPLKEKPIYQAQVTATLYGHYLLYTPPYHPELQPIELIWAMLKGAAAEIAASPPKNGNDAVQKVLDGLYAIKGKKFISVYRHAQSYENEYAQLARESSELLLMAAEDKS